MHVTSLGDFQTIGELIEMLSTLDPDAKTKCNGSPGCAMHIEADGRVISFDSFGYRVPNDDAKHDEGSNIYGLHMAGEEG